MFESEQRVSAAGMELCGGRRALYGAVLTVVTFLVLVTVGEATARIAALVVPSFRSVSFRQYDPTFGTSLIPNKRVPHHRGCFQGEVVTNGWGMRDRPRTRENPDHHLRIALLGDSVIEGVHVKPDEVMNIRMERLLTSKGYRNAEVLNFGVAGIGTTQELLIYKEHVRRFQPDIVVLVFVGNDVMNNSSVIESKAYGIHTWYAPYYNLGPNGDLVFVPVQRRVFGRLRAFLERHSVLMYYLERLWARVNLPLYTWEGVPMYFGVYGDPPDVQWKTAWLITEKLLVLLNETVSQDGPRFIVLVSPDAYGIDPDWRQRMVKEFGRVPPDLRLDNVENHLSDIARRNSIPLELLVPYFESYRDKHNLQWPYFSLSCDPHLSALGHEVSAEAIVEKLEQRGFLTRHSAMADDAFNQIAHSPSSFRRTSP
jgi:lysophospholipase L1-like esterase